MKIFELFSNIKHSQAFFFIELSDESDNEQKILLAESISIDFNIDKFRLGIKIAQLGFN